MSGRTTYNTLNSALATFQHWPAANIDRIREIVAELQVDEIYVPAGRKYIGVELQGGGPVVTIHSGYVWKVPTGDGRRAGVALPVNKLRDGNESANTALRGDVCPECHLEMPLSGICSCW